MQPAGRYDDHRAVLQMLDHLAQDGRFEAGSDAVEVEPVLAASGPLASQCEQRVGQPMSSQAGGTDQLEVDAATRRDHGVQLVVNVGELDQAAISEVIEQV